MAAAQKRRLAEEECHQTGSKQRKVQHETGPEDGAPRESQSTNDVLSGRSLAERQAAMSLMQFAESDSTSQLSGDRVEQLIGTLMVSCPFQPSTPSTPSKPSKPFPI